MTKVHSFSALLHDAVVYIRQHRFLQAIVFVIGWLGVWLLAYLAEYVNHASVWFPPAGLTFAGLLVVGGALIPLLVVCAIVSTLWTGYLYNLDMGMSSLLLSGVVFSVTHIIPYYIAAHFLRRLANNRVSQLPTLALLFLISAIISSLAAAFMVLYGLAYTGMMNVGDISMAWLPFWVGDMAGIIAMAPLFVGLLCHLYSNPQFWIGELRDISSSNRSHRFTLKLLISGFLLTAVFGFANRYPIQESQFAVFLMLIPLMWISYTESPIRTAFTVALFSFYTAFLVNMFGLMEHVIIYQFAICIIAGSAFFYLSVPSLIAHNQALSKRAGTDALTGAASRYQIQSQSQYEIARSFSELRPLSLIVFDVDDFKVINDSSGHIEGDRILSLVCETARGKLRRTDSLGRYGGDEFVILMPDSRLQEALQKAEFIRQDIQEIVLHDGTTISCSFGVSELKKGDDFMQLFHRADHALYNAKSGGKNMVVADEEFCLTEV